MSGLLYGWWILMFDENVWLKLWCLIYLVVIFDDLVNFFFRVLSLVLMGIMIIDDLLV